MIISMPKITPIAINIKERSPWSRVLYWQAYIRRWELLENWHYELPEKNMTIIVPKEFEFDGVSMPRIFHWFLSPTGIFFLPSLVHDFAYRYDYLWVLDAKGELRKYEEGAGRESWDDLFKELSLELNNMKILNAFSRCMLRSFGWISWNKNRAGSAREMRPEL